MQRLLDELASHIGRIEASVERGSQGGLPRLIEVNEAVTRRIMEGIGSILYDVGMPGTPSEVASQVRELAAAQLAAWSSTSPVFYHVRNTPRTEFNNFEIALLLLDAGGVVGARPPKSWTTST